MARADAGAYRERYPPPAECDRDIKRSSLIGTPRRNGYVYADRNMPSGRFGLCLAVENELDRARKLFERNRTSEAERISKRELYSAWSLGARIAGNYENNTRDDAGRSSAE
jgi:hypothetical protein